MARRMSRLSRYLRWVFRRRTVRLEAGGIEARFRRDCRADASFLGDREQREEEQKAAVLEELRDDDVVYEIGAHIGVWTVFLARRLSRGEVHAFEPDDENRGQLQANLALNAVRNVTVHGIAIGDRSGTAAFAVYPDDRDARHSLVPTEGHDRVIEVATLRLDDVPGRLGIPEPTALKIDVEGAEGLVVAGATALLERPALRLIYLEFHARMPQTGWTREKLLARLEGAGFGITGRWMRDAQLQCLAVR
jgi:FkbM family methyltransferase